MKRWTMVITTCIIMIFARESVYGVENIDSQSNRLLNEGRIVIDFMVDDTYQKDSPVKDVQVELLFLLNDEMVDIREIDELKNTTINLVSDENGKIVLNNLPYGLYQYRILNAPNGFEYSKEYEYIEVDLLNKNINMGVYLTRKIEMAEGSTIVEEPKEEIEDEKDKTNDEIMNEEIVISTPKNEEVIEEVVIEDNINALKTNVNTLSLDIYSYTENTKQVNKTANSVSKVEKNNEEEKDVIMKNTINYIRNRMKSLNQQMIMKFKEYKLSETIKIAINTIDDTMNTYKEFVTDLPNDKKNKKIKRQSILMGKIKNIKKERLYNLPLIRARVR